ncbi:MAG: hypothetical protein AAF961_08270, partial [Planctomycetota bacterium]
DARTAALESMASHLRLAIRCRPDFARAHAQLANRLTQLFNARREQSDNPMPVTQIRDAAIGSRFRSTADLQDWLDRAFGDDAKLLTLAAGHARLAAARCPLQGNAYVRLADLCFLQLQDFAVVDVLLDQAVRVRPYDGDMLVGIGAQLGARGLESDALRCWKAAYRIPGKHRKMIVRVAASHWPLSRFLKAFQPDWTTLPDVWRVARDAAAPADQAVFLGYADQIARRDADQLDGRRAARIWRSLGKMQTDVQDYPAAVASLRRAIDANPDNYDGRRMLGLALTEAGDFARARPYLRWCLARRASDAQIHAALRRPMRTRLETRPTAVSASEESPPGLATPTKDIVGDAAATAARESSIQHSYD